MAAAAKNELAFRGIMLDSTENRTKLENHSVADETDKIIEQDDNKPRRLFHGNWKQNIVTDANVPKLYSRRVIHVFSILFSVLFGGILLAINLKDVQNRKAILPVLAFSAIYTGAMAYVLGLVQGNTTGFTLAFNMAGSIILYNLFWEKYIGRNFQYRTKPFWIPAIVGFVIAILIVWVTVIGNGA